MPTPYPRDKRISLQKPPVDDHGNSIKKEKSVDAAKPEKASLDKPKTKEPQASENQGPSQKLPPSTARQGGSTRRQEPSFAPGVELASNVS